MEIEFSLFFKSHHHHIFNVLFHLSIFRLFVQVIMCFAEGCFTCQEVNQVLILEKYAAFAAQKCSQSLVFFLHF